MGNSKGDSKGDIILRGVQGPSPLGTATFVGLRGVEPFVQRLILLSSPLTTTILPRLGFHGPWPLPPVSYATSTNLITTFGLNLTPFQSILFFMSLGASVKQIFWILVTSREKMPADGAVVIALFNFVNNVVNTMLFSVAAKNPTYSTPWSMYVGLALYSAGILVEPIAEVQRKRFKDDPKNQGKPYSGGLFGLARSINYGAYTMWRAGFAMAAGGWLWGALVGGFFFWDFSTRAIPAMDEYCSKRYGKQWEEVKRKVPYKLIPGIY
jgi:protein-S-isoprenylcysteine O-methyltransferase Ste14